MSSTCALSTEVYQTLKKKIIDFELMPGQLLMVQDVAKQLNISRTPVRETMLRLREEGFLVDATGGKFQVAEITWDFITDLYQTRMILEGYAIRNMKNGVSPAFLNALENNIAKLKDDLRRSEYHELFEDDSEFHRLIIQSCGNSIIMNWLERLNDHQMRVRFLTASIGSRLHGTLAEHTAILDCIKQADYDGAVEKLNTHLQNMLDDLQKERAGNAGLINSVIKVHTGIFQA